MQVTFLNTAGAGSGSHSQRVGLRAGALVTVLSHSAKYPGFVFIRTPNNEEGMVPTTYLKVIGHSSLKSSACKPAAVLVERKVKEFSDDYQEEGSSTPRMGIEGAGHDADTFGLSGFEFAGPMLRADSGASSASCESAASSLSAAVTVMGFESAPTAAKKSKDRPVLFSTWTPSAPTPPAQLKPKAGSLDYGSIVPGPVTLLGMFPSTSSTDKG